MEHPVPYIRATQYYETDQMGIIHHASYVYWMEEARVDFMEKLGFGYEKAVATGIDFAVTGITCGYNKMCRFREQIKIETWISSITPVRMRIGYRMTGISDGSLRFTGESQHCYFSSDKKRPVSLKRELPELYALFCSLEKAADL